MRCEVAMPSWKGRHNPALMEQKRIESGKLMSFAKAKRENKKIEARQEKRDLEDKYKALEENMKQRHAQELEAFESLDESLENETGAAEYLEIDPNEGTRKSRLQKKKDLLAEIEKELREGRAEAEVAITLTGKRMMLRAPVAPQRTRIQSFEEILAAVRSGAMPSVMPVRAGSALARPSGAFTLPARSLYDSGYRGQTFGPSGEDCPQARPEMLERAKEEARIAEEQGKLAVKKGPVPSGPPGLPTGIVVIEQKYVDFLMGPGGQSLAAINHAAGVNVILDQTHKFSGYSYAKIFGPEDKVRNAKLAIDFKLSQWLPLHERRKGITVAANPPAQPSGGSQESGLWSRSATASGGIAGATKIHILRTQNPQPGTSPVKEIEDSAVKVTGGLLAVQIAMARHGTARGSAANRHGEVPVESNEEFETFYQKQGVVAEELWQEFMHTLRSPMPLVVRINRTKPHWQELQRSFKQDMRWSELSWFPSAWQCDAKDYNDALRSQCSALNKSYALRFQESASLVPPLLLEVKSSDLVLDLCAAPGSKTLECIELMREHQLQDETGVIIANDADAERCFELLPLITRKARHPGCAVVLGNGAKYPAQFRSQDDQLLYDKVICDVPCSGDGTLRRRPHCWKSWSMDFPLTLHSKQLLILCRGLHLLRPGGRLVYSTCSMNPIENEAVVVAALKRFGADVHLLPVEIPKDLRVAPCLQSWWVPAGGTFYKTWEEVPASQRKPAGPLVESMFSSGTLDPAACFRLNPHEIDGSGFFVAIFTKTSHRSFPIQIPARPSAAAIPWRARNESNRYTVVSIANSDVQSIVNFYGLRDLPEPLLAEYNIKGKLTQLNLVNDTLLQVLQSHLNCKASPLLVSVGIPLFKLLDDNFMTNIDVPSRWRPAMEGASILAKKMEKRVLRINLERMRKLLMKRLLPMQTLLSLGDELKGLESCEDKLGGAVVGTMDGSFWVPCIITGSGLELYASLEEVGDPLPKLLPPKELPVISETKDVIVLDKPCGLRTEDALRFVQQRHPSAELVSRLDKETSGCLLIPLTAESAKEFTKQFAETKVRKCYVAVVQGHPPETGHIEEALSLVQLGGGTKYRAFVDETGKAASTRYERIWSAGDQGPSVLLAYPETGRTHQIRCHLAHLGHPLVGDTKYGGLVSLWCDRLPLHCLSLEAKGLSGDTLTTFAPIPEDLLLALLAMCDGELQREQWQQLCKSRAEAVSLGS
eukprot:symbB.v1.2.033994.t1/scaffold4309.1/size41561/5